MGITASIVATLAVAQGVVQSQAVKAQNKAQSKAARIERRISEIENARRARRAIAQQRIQQANIVAGAQEAGIGGSSAAVGAAGSVGAKTAGAIGGVNTISAGRFAQSVALQKGFRDASKLQSIGSILGGAQNAAGAFGQFRLAKK